MEGIRGMALRGCQRYEEFVATLNNTTGFNLEDFRYIIFGQSVNKKGEILIGEISSNCL